MAIIKDYPSLVAWLESHSYFEDGHLLEMTESPLSLTLGYTISGNYVANTPRKILSIKLIPQNVLEWKGFSADLISQDACFEGIDPLDIQGGIGLRFCFAPYLSLIESSLIVEDPHIIETTFTPYRDPDACFLKAPMEAIPHPSYWIKKCKEHGFNTAFRYFRGQAKATEEVPYPDYTGYFIQTIDKIATTDMGIVFAWLSVKGDTVQISLKNHDGPHNALWNILKDIIADIPQVMITSGNITCTGEEWKQST